MLLQRHGFIVLAVMMVCIAFGGDKILTVECQPHRILLDTDVDTDDFFALFYLLKLNQSEFDLQVSVFFLSEFDSGNSVSQGKLINSSFLVFIDRIKKGRGRKKGILILPLVLRLKKFQTCEKLKYD